VALDQSALLEVLDALTAAEVDDRIRQAAQTIYQALIEAELTAVIGAAPHERTVDRLAQRNGHRPRLLATTAGDLELRIPKLRAGSFFPSLLERRRRVDQALFAVVMEAYLHGVSTRKVDDLVRALGADSGISKSEVSRICVDLDAEVGAFRDRSLAGQVFPYVFWTPPTARPGSTAAWSPRPWWWPLAWLVMVAARSLASAWATARTGRSGRRSCAR
jgi:transposase-like protein